MGSALPVQEPSMDDILASIRRIIEGREDRIEPDSSSDGRMEQAKEGRAAEAGQPAAKTLGQSPSAKTVGLTASNDEGKTPFAGATQTADAERIASKVEELATLSVARMRAASLENAVRDYRETEMAAELQGEEAAMDTQFDALSGSVPSFYDEFDEAAFASELLANAGLATSDDDDEVGESARLNERRSRPAFETLQASVKPLSTSERPVAQQAAERSEAEAAPLATVAVLGLARPAKPDMEEEPVRGDFDPGARRRSAALHGRRGSGTSVCRRRRCHRPVACEGAGWSGRSRWRRALSGTVVPKRHPRTGRAAVRRDFLARLE